MGLFWRTGKNVATVARKSLVCTFVKDVRTLSEAHDPEFVKTLQQIRAITTRMNDSTMPNEAA
jgi:hypothetical protein